ncbi:MAG: LolA family protein [Planctomycetaceae bacterium]
MKSLPRLTLAVFVLAAAGYWLTTTSLFGFQEPAGKRPPATPATKDSAKDSPKERSADAAGPESAEAKGALDQARQRLLRYKSIKAKLVETVALSSRRFTVHGSYLQGSSADLKLRLEFQVKLGDTEGSVLEVCDGQVVWSRHQIGDEPARITRRDVRQILKAAADHGYTDNLVTVDLGFGGLPGLFASIEQSMQFDQFKADTAEGQKLVVIEGGWKDHMLKGWQGNNPKAQLPEYVPSRIRIYFDGESLFPRRILYLRRNPDQRLRPMVSLDFSEVETDIAIPAGKFKFVPPDGVFPDDLTPQFVKQIEQRKKLGGQ